MDTSINTIDPVLPPQVLDETLTKLMPLSSSDSTTKPEPKTAISDDALQAIKLDPAVLEAQVTVENCGRPASSLSRSSNGQSQDYTRASSVTSSRSRNHFDEMMDLQKAALRSLTPQQFELLMKFTDTLRRQRLSNQMNLECAFCKNNGESVAWYSSHGLRSWRGLVQCPVLRAYCCPRCGATGDHAHTIKYCPVIYVSDSQ